MPRFLGRDYYSEMTSEKASFVTKALLVVPKLGKHNDACCLHVPLCSEYQECPVELESPLDHFSENVEISHSAMGVGHFQSSPALITYIDSDGVEVVPSSNPDSQEYESELIPVTEQLVYKPFRECFSKDNSSLEGTHNPFEDNIFLEEKPSASSIMPSVEFLLSRIEPVPLQDPLRKGDGTLWAEQDFFKSVYSNNSPTKTEMGRSFEDLNKFDKEQLNYGIDPFLSQPMPEVDTDSHDAEMCISTTISMLSDTLDVKTDRFLDDTKHDFMSIADVAEISCLTNMGCNVVNAEPVDNFTLFKNITRTYDDVEENSLKQQLTPFLQLQELELEGATTPLCNVPLIDETVKNLNITKCKEFNSSISLLTSRESSNLEFSMWQKDRNNDAMQLPEPNIPWFEEPVSVLEEISNTLNLKLDTEDSMSPNLFEKPPVVWIPLLHIDDPEKEKHATSDDQGSLESEKFDKEVIDKAKERKEQEVHINIEQFEESLNPLDSFLLLRSESKSKLKESCLNREVIKPHQQPQLKGDTPVQNRPQKPLNAECQIKLLKIQFTGPFERLLSCISDCAMPCMSYMKSTRRIPAEKYFIDLSVDFSWFLLRETEKNVTNQKLQEVCLQYASCLHTLRTAADILLNICLEACCSYLSSQIEKLKDLHTALGTLAELHRNCYSIHCQALKDGILHPKMEALLLEVHRFCEKQSGEMMLVVIPRDCPSLKQVIKSTLSTVSQVTIVMLPEFTAEATDRSNKTTVCIIQYVEAMPASFLSQFSLVIQYHEAQGSYFKNACKEQECSFIGLITEIPTLSYTDTLEVQICLAAGITVICSTEISHNEQLLCLLEARYNINLIERDYAKLQAQGSVLYYADVTVSLTCCAVMLSVAELDHCWDMAKVFKRYAALGLQYSQIFIIVHGIGQAQGYFLGKETTSHLYKLRASLSNLSRASDKFCVHFKVLIRLAVADIAACIRSLADMASVSHRDSDLQRLWLTADITQDEEILLKLPCMSSFSAQFLLSKLKLTDVLRMSFEEMKNSVPGMPEAVLRYLKHLTAQWQVTSKKVGSCSSQASANTSFTTDMSVISSGHTGSPAASNTQITSLTPSQGELSQGSLIQYLPTTTIPPTPSAVVKPMSNCSVSMEVKESDNEIHQQNSGPSRSTCEQSSVYSEIRKQIPQAHIREREAILNLTDKSLLLENNCDIHSGNCSSGWSSLNRNMVQNGSRSLSTVNSTVSCVRKASGKNLLLDDQTLVPSQDFETSAVEERCGSLLKHKTPTFAKDQARMALNQRDQTDPAAETDTHFQWSQETILETKKYKRNKQICNQWMSPVAESTCGGESNRERYPCTDIRSSEKNYCKSLLGHNSSHEEYFPTCNQQFSGSGLHYLNKGSYASADLSSNVQRVSSLKSNLMNHFGGGDNNFLHQPKQEMLSPLNDSFIKDTPLYDNVSNFPSTYDPLRKATLGHDNMIIDGYNDVAVSKDYESQYNTGSSLSRPNSKVNNNYTPKESNRRDINSSYGIFSSVVSRDMPQQDDLYLQEFTTETESQSSRQLLPASYSNQSSFMKSFEHSLKTIDLTNNNMSFHLLSAARRPWEYGIFSSAVSRDTAQEDLYVDESSTDTTPLSNYQLPIANSSNQSSFVKSLNHNLKDGSFDSTDNFMPWPLPRAARRRHLNKAEEQNLYKMRDTFMSGFDQSGSTSREGRLTHRRYDRDTDQLSEMQSATYMGATNKTNPFQGFSAKTSEIPYQQNFYGQPSCTDIAHRSSSFSKSNDEDLSASHDFSNTISNQVDNEFELEEDLSNNSKFVGCFTDSVGVDGLGQIARGYHHNEVFTPRLEHVKRLTQDDLCSNTHQKYRIQTQQMHNSPPRHLPNVRNRPFNSSEELYLAAEGNKPVERCRPFSGHHTDLSVSASLQHKNEGWHRYKTHKSNTSGGLQPETNSRWSKYGKHNNLPSVQQSMSSQRFGLTVTARSDKRENVTDSQRHGYKALSEADIEHSDSQDNESSATSRFFLQSLSPPMDFSPTECRSEIAIRKPDSIAETSKLKKWQAYLQGKTQRNNDSEGSHN